MSIHWPKVRLDTGDTVTFDGSTHEIVGRPDGPDGADTFLVENDEGRDERHIDWFADRAADAGRIVIERGTRQ